LKLHTPSAKLRETLVLTLLGVLMYVSQVLMSQLPNIEIVTLLIVLTTKKFGYKALISVYVFVGLEILTYGISDWVIKYLYVWSVLCFIICISRKIEGTLFYTLISSVFGLLFGILCSPVDFFIGGFAYGITSIVKGIPFDLLHGFGNFITVILLYKPLKKALDKAMKY
jgi:energy-coupling factor transport system substrate-specific component